MKKSLFETFETKEEKVMPEGISRRDVFRVLGTTALGAGAASFAGTPEAAADTMGKGTPAAVRDGKVIQPQRELPVLHQTDVLVVGGGPAGTAAAIAARRTGAEVTLVERYGHFGGLCTGGLVLLVIGHLVPGNKQVGQGICEEMMKRLEKFDRGICDRRPGVNPTVDAEALKYLMVEMITEAEIDVFLHCWGVDAVMDGNTVRGAVFESKSGRQAILAKTVVDATGDGDLFGAAGAKHENRVYHIGLPCRIGNLDKIDPAKANGVKKPRGLGSHSPIQGVNWVNMHGPDTDGLDVAALSRLELNHRKQIWKTVEAIRATSGYEKVYLMETAPQLGVRITRVLAGTNTITRKGLDAGTRFPDVVGVGGSIDNKSGPWQIPYGALLPQKVENVLASGRCVSHETRMADLVRVIPNCFVTGHAAGVAAAVSVQDGCSPRNVDIAKIQKILKDQDAYLG